MSDRMRLAIPSMGDGGLDGERSGHFGHCDCFTLVDIADNEIAEVRVVQNPPHQEGGCLRPVALLAAEGVNAIVVAGMGPRPLAGFNEAGIDVYFDSRALRVADAVQLVMGGSAETMQPGHACGGHGGCGH